MSMGLGSGRDLGGWFRVGWTNALISETVVPLERFDEDLALYRGSSGRPMLIEPFCPHMGAHLGYGGCVQDDDIICPFHGWRWGPDGVNVDIPYSSARSRREVPHRAVIDWAGSVWTWFDGAGSGPSWDLGGYPPPEHSPSATQEWSVAAPIQAVLDVIADAPFLARLLGVELDAPTLTVAGHECRITHHDLSTGEEIRVDVLGPGVVLVRSSHRPGSFVQSQTPISPGALSVGCATFGAPGGNYGWWGELLNTAVPILDGLRFTTELEDQPGARAVGELRSWLETHATVTVSLASTR